MRYLAGLLAFVAALFITGCGGSNDSSNATLSGSSALQPTAKFTAGVLRDVIVVFDDSEALKNTTSFQHSKNVSSADPAAQEFKKSQLQAIKAKALSQIEPGTLAVVT